MTTAGEDGAPGPPPDPPADLERRELPVEVVRAGTVLSRIHPAGFAAIFFGPVDGAPPRGRWDAPRGGFRVCYLAEKPETAFAETFLRAAGLVVLDPADLAARNLATVLVMRDLRLASVSGRGLARLGATAAVCSGPYAVSRSWAEALHAHPSRPDGIRYRARHDDDGHAVAAFDRACDALEEIDSRPLTSRHLAAPLGEWVDRYGVGVI